MIEIPGASNQGLCDYPIDPDLQCFMATRSADGPLILENRKFVNINFAASRRQVTGTHYGMCRYFA